MELKIVKGIIDEKTILKKKDEKPKLEQVKDLEDLKKKITEKYYLYKYEIERIYYKINGSSDEFEIDSDETLNDYKSSNKEEPIPILIDIGSTKEGNLEKRNYEKNKEFKKQLDASLDLFRVDIMKRLEKIIDDDYQNDFSYNHKIKCSNCNEVICGLLCKCEQCENYNLCEKCYIDYGKKAFHDKHLFIAVLDDDSYALQKKNTDIN